MVTNNSINSLNLQGVIQPQSGAYDVDELVKYLAPIHAKNVNVDFGVNTYTHGITAAASYFGSVYSPTQNRVYFVPYRQSDETDFHYLNCDTGEIIAYTHGATIVDNGYKGGVYSPNEDRIYFCPCEQAAETNWHYIDCSDGTVVAYEHGVTAVIQGYEGGCYSPTQDRIYFSPYDQGAETNWHYIDCSDGTVVAYEHGVTSTTNSGAVYSPTQDRIYFVPKGQSDDTYWFYIDCSDGSVGSYENGVGIGNNAFSGGAYSPTQNRIYMAPSGTYSQNATFTYLDCDDTTVHTYTSPSPRPGINAFNGGVYSPTQNRIYFVPYLQSSVIYWYYIDCNTGILTSYLSNVTAVNYGYQGGTYVPTLDRIYLAPSYQAPQTTWHYIQSYAQAEIAPQVMSNGLFNKF